MNNHCIQQSWRISDNDIKTRWQHEQNIKYLDDMKQILRG